MIDSYTTDIIRLVEIAQDKFGAETVTESADIAARIEDLPELERGFNGKENMPGTPKMYIAFSYTVNIEPQWKIKIKQKHGVAYYQPDKLWEIKKFENLGMFEGTHVEVYI
jgi:hypothetical protein